LDLTPQTTISPSREVHVPFTPMGSERTTPAASVRMESRAWSGSALVPVASITVIPDSLEIPNSSTPPSATWNE